jgi:lipopolysaccharide/colanic/teichoic acid biosynthesis glycosyltransferase
MYKFFFKRIIDVLVSIFFLLIIIPLFLFVIILIKIDSKGPIFYCQDRLGINGNIFRLFKFRTMSHKIRQNHTQTYEGDPEITRIGSVLRRLKIDELPQLINILLGNMSLVGPRPCLPELLVKFNDDAYSRLKVKPGLTGLAQINGNIYLSWEERWIYDKKYVENISFLLDLKILCRTFLIIIFGEKKFKNNGSEL